MKLVESAEKNSRRSLNKEIAFATTTIGVAVGTIPIIYCHSIYFRIDLYNSRATIHYMYSNILLSTDGTVASEQAESHAIDLAATHDATLHALYVVDEKVVNAYSGDEYVDEAEGPEHGLEEHGEETLSSLRSQANTQNVQIVDAIRHGRPDETIIQHADDNAVDLIVLGTKRQPDEYRALLGSVTDRVLRLATQPVTVVKTETSD